jgi:WD40 repeat protein
MVDRDAVIDENAPPTEPGQLDAFISYSHHDPDDMEFVDALDAWLHAHGKASWVDRGSIEPAADWRDRVTLGIEAATALVFVITPESATSIECRNEIDQAAAHNKRVVPVVLRTVDPHDLPETVTAPNWIWCTDPTDRERAFNEILEALDQDLEWRDMHTRLAVRAREWTETGEERSRLLRGSDLRAAEAWYGEKSAHKEQPTDEQYRYITASRRAVGRRQRVVIVAVSLALVTSIALAVFAFIQRNHAQQESYRAQTGEMVAEANNVLTTNAPAGMLVAINAARRGDPTENSRDALGLAARQPVVSVFDVGTRPVDAVACSPDGQTLAAADDSGNVTLWNTAARTKSTTLNYLADGYGQKPTISLAFSPDGSMLVAGGSDGAVTLWDLRTQKRFAIAGGGIGDPTSVAFNPTGESFAAAETGEAVIYDTNTHKKLRTLSWKASDTVAAVAPVGFDAAGSQIAVGDLNGNVHIWDATTGKSTHDYTPGNAVTALAWSPTHYLTIGLNTGQTVTFDTTTNQNIASLREQGAVNGLAYGPSDTDLAASHENGDVSLFDALSLVKEPALSEGSAVNAVAFSPSGANLATANSAGQVVIVNAAEIRAGASLTADAFSPDGNTIAVGDFNGDVTLWDAHTRQWRATINDGNRVRAVVFLDNTTIAIGDEQQVSVWNTDARKQVATFSGISKGPGYELALSADRHTLAVLGNTGGTTLWNVADPSHPSDVSLQDAGISGDLAGGGGNDTIAMAPNGGSVIVGNADGWVVDWPIPGSTSAPIFKNSSTVNVLAASPDGNIVAVGDPSEVVLWSRTARRIVGTLHEGAGVTALTFANGGATLLSGTTTGQLIAWDVASHARLAVLDDGDSGPVRAIATDATDTTLSIADQYGRLAIMPTFWSTDVANATRALCSELNGYELDRGQWQTYIPSESFRRTC